MATITSEDEKKREQEKEAQRAEITQKEQNLDAQYKNEKATYAAVGAVSGIATGVGLGVGGLIGSGIGSGVVEYKKRQTPEYQQIKQDRNKLERLEMESIKLSKFDSPESQKKEILGDDKDKQQNKDRIKGMAEENIENTASSGKGVELQSLENSYLYENSQGNEFSIARAKKDHFNSIGNDLRTEVSNDEIHTVTQNRTVKVNGKQTIDITGDEVEAYRSDLFVQIQGLEQRIVEQQQLIEVGLKALHEYKNELEQIIDKDYKRTVKEDEIVNITGDQLFKIGGDKEVNVVGEKRERIEKNYTLRVLGNKKEDIEGNKKFSINGNAVWEIKGDLMDWSLGKLSNKFTLGASNDVFVGAKSTVTAAFMFQAQFARGFKMTRGKLREILKDDEEKGIKKHESFKLKTEDFTSLKSKAVYEQHDVEGHLKVEVGSCYLKSKSTILVEAKQISYAGNLIKIG